MQHNKTKKNLSEIKNYCEDSTKLLLIFKELLDVLNLTYINKLFSKSKQKGIDAKNVFQILFSLRFLDLKNIQQLTISGYSKELCFKKDVFYEFMKNPLIDWRKIVHLFGKQILQLIIKESEKEENPFPKFLILDDSLVAKSGRCIEFIGKVYDHCLHKYALGMKLLTLGYCDSKSFLPLDFSLHNEPGKKGNRGLRKKDLEKQYSKERNENQASYQRVLEVSKDKITTALSLLARAVKKGIQADYILVDSWFVNEKFMTEVHKIKKQLFVIGLMKTNRIITYKKKNHKASLIPEIYRKKIKYSRKLKCHYIPLLVDYKGIEMKAFWVKMKGQQNWKMLVTTNTSLSFIKTMEYYQIRWSIEVFFKDCKQNLNLNGCQSVDFDAHIAHFSIVFMNYMTLALRKRIDDYETIGGLFRHLKEILLEETLIQKIWELFTTFFSVFLSELGVQWELFIQKLIDSQQELNQQIKKTFDCFFSITQTS